MPIRRVLVENKVGAITGFATINNLFYCLTAGHVLTGDNNSIERNEKVSVFDDIKIEWLPAGISDSIYFTRGINSPPNNFGTLDAGIFSLITEFKNYAINRLYKLNIHPSIINRDFQRLVGMRVFSYSVMYNKVISATIAEIFGHSDIGNRYDLIIDSDDSDIITTLGDSGILWHDVNGFAIGMHTNGNGIESNISYTTFIHRIVNIFHIQSLYVLK